jgi:hypothetical protein
VGNLEDFGVALSNKDWRVKNWRGYEFVEMQTAASKCFALHPPFRN